MAARAAYGTFYVYFPSWEDLLITLRNHILSDYAAEVRIRFARAGAATWWRLLDEECVRFIDFVIGLDGLHEAIFHGPIADRLMDDQRSAPNLLAELLRAGVGTRALKPLDIEPSAILLFSVLHSTADAIACGGNRARLVRSTRELIRRWLKRSKKRDMAVGVAARET